MVNNAFFHTNNTAMETPKLIITPKTKILELIETYPKLEELLIEIAPAFKKLKNPILRKTVAKITSVQQAAGIGKIKPQELVNRLRTAVGQDKFELSEESEVPLVYEQPAWFDEAKITTGLDVKLLLDEGEHPVHQVISDLKKLSTDQIYAMRAPFLTVPLIDKATGLGFKHWIREISETDFLIYFIKEEEK